MTKRKQNLIIVTTLLVLLLVLLFFLISLPAPQKSSTSDENKIELENIIDTKDKKIVKISLKNSKEAYDISVEKKDNKSVYILSDNDESNTSQTNAKVLYDSLINLKPDQIIENADNLSVYGLEKPVASLTLTFDNNENVILLLGNDAPLYRGSYMKIDNDSKIFLINQADKEVFLNEKSFYQEKQ